MRSRHLLFALFVLCVTPTCFGCASTVSVRPIEHPDIVKCGGPMANEVAKRAANVAFSYASQPGNNAADLERLIANEIGSVAKEFGPGFAGCLIEKVLNAQRPSLAVLPKRSWLLAPRREDEPLAGLGFVPIPRDLDHARPWHSLLAGARGIRS
jgi:hypothetical protein